MNRGLEQELRMVTSGLTGRREYDIPYLKNQIQEYAADVVLTSRLANVLAAISFTKAGETVAYTA